MWGGIMGHTTNAVDEGIEVYGSRFRVWVLDRGAVSNIQIS